MKPKNNSQVNSDSNGNKLSHVAHRSLFVLAWVRFCRHRLAFSSLFIAFIYTCLTLLSPILPIYSYRIQVTSHANLPPSFRPAGELLLERLANQQQRLLAREGLSEPTPEMLEEKKALQERIANEKMTDSRAREVYAHQRRYLLGTDALGRDLLARTLFGGRISILIGLIGTFISVLIGSLIGALSAYIGGIFDYITVRLIDVLYSLPFIIIVVVLMAFLGRGFVNLFIALALVSWLTAARMVRGQIFTLRNLSFVEAAVSMGASTPRILFNHLIPNCFSVIIVFSTLRVPSLILFESFLSFLGLGVSAPLASWGLLIQEGARTLAVYPWQLWVPTTAMSVFLMVTNFLGDGVRDALDPKHKVAR